DQIETIEELRNHTIWKIYEASNNQLWLCTRNKGLILFDKKNGIVAQFNSENSNLTTDNIRTIEHFKDNIFWIGTERDGLFSLNMDTQGIVKIDSITDNIKSLFQENRRLWIGTNGNGLKSYEPSTGEILHFTVKTGLPNNVVYGILPDEEGNLWLSSN